MPDRLFRLYQRRRIINLNANIIASGLLSTVVVMVLLWVLKLLGAEWPTWGYTAFSVVADLIFDVAIFAGLHWVANHWRPLRPGDCPEARAVLDAKRPSYLKDTGRLQFERAVISPVYYIIAAGLTETLQRQGMSPVWAVGIAYPIGLAATRCLHTMWGLRSGTYLDDDRRQ